ncbi:CD209 antigen-like protein A isoform X1 [Poecilia latipinna]|uniref:CD209 antigen-like protein A isoform X1 n=1 Tax=Poecilia latipinna TaxID=48699 RepID=UPI00072ECC8B|nr:PREDICTED: CD209 antigen-like protein A isoform X1 [Poecilia latipinna]XP_014877713.1 PREDICTED: CD209 antigen-like protein A isoform X1 [Poecilia latipinna]
MATIDDQISVEYEEPASAAKSRDAKSPGRNFFLLLLLSFGFLCILQSALNVSLRLTSLRSSFKQRLATFCPSIYYISSAVATWGESRNDCLKRGADLVIINSRDEQDFLTWYKKRLWIGLTDAEKEGEWKWVDGTRLNTSYWGPDEPNSDLGENEDCGEMRFFESENNWNDVSCGIKNSWICERKLQE